MRFSILLTLFLLTASVVFIVSLCEKQGNGFIWGGEFQYFTAPVLSFPEHTFSDIFYGSPMVVKHSNGTLYYLQKSGMQQIPYTQTNAKMMCTKVVGVSSSYIVVSNQGNVYGWGFKVGDGSDVTKSTPVQIQGLLQGKVVTQCVATTSSVSVLTNDNKIFSWGNGIQGLLGNGKAVPSYEELSPVATIMTGALNEKTVLDLKATSVSVHVLANDKKVYSWGMYYALGYSATQHSGTPTAVDMSGALNGTHVKQLEAAATHGAVFVVTTDNRLYAWGKNQYGLVSGPDGPDQKTPVAVNTTVLGDSIISKIYTGGAELYIETTDKRLFAAGNNEYYQISRITGATSRPLTEIDLSGIPDGVIIQKLVSIPIGHTAILGSDSKLYMWGNFEHSGRKIESIPYLPNIRNVTFNTTDIKHLYPGTTNTIAETNSGRFYVWGSNSAGEAGQGHKLVINNPVEITGYDIAQLVVYETTNLIVTNSGTVYGWGSNANGEIGDGTNIDRTVPTKLETNGTDIGKINRVSLGSKHALALSDKNILYAWGDNASGQLGVGNTIPSKYLVAVNMTDINREKLCKFYAGPTYNLVITRSGNLYGWGAHSNGVLLNGKTSGSTSSPTRMNITTLENDSIVTISTGTNFVSVLTKSGKIYGWGLNTNGQLGIGKTSSAIHTPVQVNVTGTGLEGKKVLKIVAVNSKSYALTSDGQLFGWGSGGTLGAGLSADSLQPTKIALSNIPSGMYVTDIAGSVNNMGLVVQNKPPSESDFEGENCFAQIRCYGTPSSSPNVCSSRGSCIADGYCKCNQGFGGYICQRKCPNCYLNYKL